MSGIALVCLGLALAAVLGTLGLGLFCMAKGGEFSRKYSNRIMQARVGLQGAAIVLFVLAFAVSGR